MNRGYFRTFSNLKKAAATAAPVAAAPVAAAAATASGDRIFISPFAKKIATEQGIDVNQMAGQGTGPSGRIRADDVRNFTPSVMVLRKSKEKNHFFGFETFLYFDIFKMKHVVEKKIITSFRNFEI